MLFGLFCGVGMVCTGKGYFLGLFLFSGICVNLVFVSLMFYVCVMLLSLFCWLVFCYRVYFGYCFDSFCFFSISMLSLVSDSGFSSVGVIFLSVFVVGFTVFYFFFICVLDCLGDFVIGLVLLMLIFSNCGVGLLVFAGIWWVFMLSMT